MNIENLKYILSIFLPDKKLLESGKRYDNKGCIEFNKTCFLDLSEKSIEELIGSGYLMEIFVDYYRTHNSNYWIDKSCEFLVVKRIEHREYISKYFVITSNKQEIINMISALNERMKGNILQNIKATELI